MFDMEMIRACAKMYPVELFTMCVFAAITIPLTAFMMFQVVSMLMED